MAKAGFWLRGTTGKLAGSALQKGNNGNTIIREIVKPKNPKTSQQTIQRVLLNTVVQAYSALKEITSHSFQGVDEGGASMRYFMKLNMRYFRRRAKEVGSDNLSSYVNFEPIGDKGIRPAQFIISDGKLPTVPVTITSDAFLMQIELPENTYQSVIDTYNLKRGDQLTFVTIEKHTVDQKNYVHMARVILDPRTESGEAAELSIPFVTETGRINLPNERNQGNFSSLQFASNAIKMRMSAGIVCAAGCIVSREGAENEWQRSECQLVLCEEAIAAEAVSLPEAISLSRQGYSIGFEDENGLYLNYSGVGGGQSTGSGSSSNGGSGSNSGGTNSGGTNSGNSGDEPGEDRP